MKRVAKFQEGGNVEMTAAERRRQNMQRLNERMRPGSMSADYMRRLEAELTSRPRMMDSTSPEARANIDRQIQESRERQPRSPAAPSMRDAVRPVAPGTAPRSPAESMRQAVRPVTPSGSGMRAPGIAGLLGAGVALGGAALDAYRNRRPSGPYEQGMEPEGTPEATIPEAERNPPMPQVSGRSYDIGEGGTPQAAPTPRPSAPVRPAARPAPRPASRASSAAEDLNEIVLRLTRGEKPVTETEKRIADRMGIAYKKGGMVKAKTAMKKGGTVKPKAPAKKMKSGGKVAPKKMMKGGMTSKPKKMMGGGRAMHAKGGMAKGCK